VSVALTCLCNGGHARCTGDEARLGLSEVAATARGARAWQPLHETRSGLREPLGSSDGSADGSGPADTPAAKASRAEEAGTDAPWLAPAPSTTPLCSRLSGGGTVASVVASPPRARPAAAAGDGHRERTVPGGVPATNMVQVGIESSSRGIEMDATLHL